MKKKNKRFSCAKQYSKQFNRAYQALAIPSNLRMFAHLMTVLSYSLPLFLKDDDVSETRKIKKQATI